MPKDVRRRNKYSIEGGLLQRLSATQQLVRLLGEAERAARPGVPTKVASRPASCDGLSTRRP